MTVSPDKRRKLTDEQREEIRRRYPGELQKDLAAEYGVSKQTIQNITNPAQYARTKAYIARYIRERKIVDPEFRQRLSDWENARWQAKKRAAVRSQQEAE